MTPYTLFIGVSRNRDGRTIFNTTEPAQPQGVYDMLRDLSPATADDFAREHHLKLVPEYED